MSGKQHPPEKSISKFGYSGSPSEAFEDRRGASLGLLASVSLVFLSMQYSGSDFGLPGFITGKRIGLLILFYAFIKSQMTRRRGASPSSPLPIMLKLMIMLHLVVMYWGLVSTLFSQSDIIRAIVYISSWLILTSSVCMFYVTTYNRVTYLEWAIVRVFPIAALVLGAGMAAWLFIQGGQNALTNVFRANAILNEFSGGTNRNLNMLFYLNTVPLAICLGFIRVPILHRLTSFASVLVFIGLSLLTSSRQTIGAIAIYLFILLFMMIVGFTPETRRVILRRRSIALMSLAIGIVFFIAASSFINTVMITDTIASLQDSMSRRILDRTWSEILGTSARAIIYQDAWRIAAENPFFGIGPGMFLDSPMNTIGKHTHSGYLELLTAEGFLIISLVCAFLFLFIVFYVLKHESIKSNLYYIFLPFSIVMIFWMINLNDLLRDYMLWLSLVTVIISVNLTRGPRAINAQLARAER